MIFNDHLNLPEAASCEGTNNTRGELTHIFVKQKKSIPMGLVLQKLLGGGGPIVELDHSFQCCNDEVHSSSSISSLHTHASHHIHTAREKENVANTTDPCQEHSFSVQEQGLSENRSDSMDGR